MVRKTSSATASSKTVAKPAAKTAAKKVRSRATATPAVLKSAEIKPRRVIADTARKLKSPKVLVPLAVAVGVGVAAITRLLNGHKDTGTALTRLGKNVSPHLSTAVHALADLGRELRAKVR